MVSKVTIGKLTVIIANPYIVLGYTHIFHNNMTDLSEHQYSSMILCEIDKRTGRVDNVKLFLIKCSKFGEVDKIQ